MTRGTDCTEGLRDVKTSLAPLRPSGYAFCHPCIHALWHAHGMHACSCGRPCGSNGRCCNFGPCVWARDVPLGIACVARPRPACLLYVGGPDLSRHSSAERARQPAREERPPKYGNDPGRETQRCCVQTVYPTPRSFLNKLCGTREARSPVARCRPR
jgi:hypothetical protein